MKITNISIFLIFFTILLISFPAFPANHFVDKNASGLNNGTSWNNAWESLSSINWGVINPGDTIFISGGKDSVVYNETLNTGASGSTGKLIVITKGTTSGHNGKVIIDGQNTRTYCINARSYKYVEYSYLNLQNATSSEISLNTSNCIVSHCIFFHTQGISFIDNRGNNNIIEYNIGDETATPISGSFGGNGDFIQTTTGGGHIFRYNHVTLRDANTGDHTDFLQFWAVQSSCTIYGNYCTHADTKTNNAQGVYMTTSNIRLTCYNNVFYFPYAKHALAINNVGGYTGTMTAYNNTIYGGTGSAEANAWFSNGVNNIILENNIFYSGNSVSPLYFTKTPTGSTIDYNIYYTTGSYPVYNGGGKSWSAWQALGFDAHGYNANPLFTNAPNQLTIKSNSPAINSGINLSSVFSTDFNGNARGSTWDIGAYQYSANVTPTGVVVNADIILAGTFNGSSMSTTLYDNGYIPLSQPYNLPPWNYNGTESVSSIPSNTVDWVLIELRGTTSAVSVVATRAAFLKSDGTITDLDGTSPVFFSTVAPGSYYIVIKHRNHLAVMSANKVNLNMNSSNYNFTDNETKAYGTNAMEDLGNGKYGLYSGDGNGDGTISQSDIINVWLPQFLNSKDGYQSADFNLDGSVTASDNNIFWLNNNGISSQVPN